MNKILISLFLLIFGIVLITYGIYFSRSTGYFVYEEKSSDIQTENESIQPSEATIEEIVLNKSIELKCPDSCDDKNPCTTDGCSKETNYTCSYITIIPCCGNGVCESEESCSSCSMDCDECPVQQPITNITNETQNYTQQTLNHIVITEFVTRGPSGALDEFVEIYNPTTMSIDISGWKLQYKSATGPTWYSKVGDGLPENSIIKSSGYFLLASKNYSLTIAPDYRHTATWGFSDSGGHIRIIDKDGNVIDKIGYGENADEPEGSAIIDISILSINGSLERKNENGNYIDTDNNLNDFITSLIPNPQKST